MDRVLEDLQHRFDNIRSTIKSESMPETLLAAFQRAAIDLFICKRFDPSALGLRDLYLSLNNLEETLEEVTP